MTNFNLNRISKHLLVLASLMGTTQSFAQSYGAAAGRNPWIQSRNYAGIRQDLGNVSFAEASVKTVSGAFKPASEALTSWDATATAGSITHLSKVSFRGSTSYRQFEGEQMKGSMFTRPGFYPLDFIEFSPGHKTLQTYRVEGGFSVDLDGNWRLGAGLDFESSDYSKRDNLCHSNYRTDLEILPSIMYHKDGFAFGASIVLGWNDETLTAGQKGSGADPLEVYLDKGLYYGTRQEWTSGILHLNDSDVRGFPVEENYLGIAAQVQKGGFYADAEYIHRNGTMGGDHNVWYRFPGYNINASASWKGNGHSLSAKFKFLHQENNETVAGKTVSGGITFFDGDDATRVFSRNNSDLAVEYGWSPSSSIWGLRTIFDGRIRDGLSTPMYPYSFSQTFISGRLTAIATLKTGRFAGGVGMSFGEGVCLEEDRSAKTGDVTVSEPERLDSYYRAQKEHLTVPYITPQAYVRYNFNAIRGAFLQLGGECTKGFNVKVLAGDIRWNAYLRLGYSF